MRRRVKALSIVTATTLSLAGAGLATLYWVGPEPTTGLTYDDVDSAMLAKTTVVVATSRQPSHSPMRGSTLLIDSNGHGKRIDNDGLDGVNLAYDGTLVGFADEGHDYLLGSDRAVRPRSQEAPQSVGASHLSHGRLVSLFDRNSPGGGFRVAETGAPVRDEPGWVMGSADCSDGLWAAVGAGGMGDPSSVVDFRRIAPQSETSRPVDVGTGTLHVEAMTCDGQHLLAVGQHIRDEQHAQNVVAVLNVQSGRTQVVTLDRAAAPPIRMPTVWTAAVHDRDLFVVQTSSNNTDRAELWRINIRNGRGHLVTKVSGVDPYSDLQFRFDRDLLYVLDPTDDKPSVLSAIDLDTGKTVGRLEMDPLNKMVNGPFTSFESTQFVRDFVVLRPPEKW